MTNDFGELSTNWKEKKKEKRERITEIKVVYM